VQNVVVALPGALSALGSELSANGWELALEVIEEGLTDDVVPSLVRLGRVSQFGDMPTFITELGREVERPMPERMRVGGPLAAIARDHARQREALGFAPREVVMEFLLLRRVLWRFVAGHLTGLESGDVIEIERRINDTIDRIVVECVVAYFDRVTSELAYQARRDPLTELLNHQALTGELERELERARRYGHGLTLVFFDIDRFKQINDTLGHPEGDRVLRSVAALVRETLRRTDLAGRMGGDEFAVALVESDLEAGGGFRRRLGEGVAEMAAQHELPGGFALSAGCAHFPTDAAEPDALLRLADADQYEAKRAKGA
jgi:diguanylate cyclase (GGDEF)-like protein